MPRENRYSFAPLSAFRTAAIDLMSFVIVTPGLVKVDKVRYKANRDFDVISGSNAS